MADRETKPTDDRPAMTRHLAWLQETADRLEQEATEEEVLATGRAMAGSLSGRYYFDAASRTDEKRARAIEYRHKAMALRIEEINRRRATAKRHH